MSTSPDAPTTSETAHDMHVEAQAKAEESERHAASLKVFANITRELTGNDPTANTLMLAFCCQLIAQLGQAHQAGMMRSHVDLMWRLLIKGSGGHTENIADLERLRAQLDAVIGPLLSHDWDSTPREQRKLPPLLSVHRSLFEQTLSVTLLVTHEETKGLLAAAENGSLPAREKLLQLFKSHTRHLLPSTITRHEQDEYEAWLEHMASNAIDMLKNEH